MPEYKPQIEFNGKKMNLLEARLYYWGLRLGFVKINLNVTEERDYTTWKKIRDNRNELSMKLAGEKLFKNLSKEKYSAEGVESQIKSVKSEINNMKYNKKNRKYCEKHGHIEKEGSAYCTRCGIAYEPRDPIKNPFHN